MSRIGNGKGLLIIGILVAVGMGALLIVSQRLNANASSWYSTQATLLANQRNQGIISIDEYNERIWQNQMTRDAMLAQLYTVEPIASAGVYIGFLLIFIGLIVFSTEGGVDEQTKRILLTIAGIMLFVMLITFTGTLTLTLTPP